MIRITHKAAKRLGTANDWQCVYLEPTHANYIFRAVIWCCDYPSTGRFFLREGNLSLCFEHSEDAAMFNLCFDDEADVLDEPCDKSMFHLSKRWQGLYNRKRGWKDRSTNI